MVVDGFAEDPQPTITVTPPPGTQLTLAGVSPNISSSVQIINGRMSQTKSVRFIFHYRLVTAKPGKYTLGPFRVSQDSLEVETRPASITTRDIPAGGAQRIQMKLPDGPYFVGQRVPIAIEWWVEDELFDRLLEQRAQVPLFEMKESFRFEELLTAEESKNALLISGSSGDLKLPAQVRRESSKGVAYLVVATNRIMIPLKAGKHVIEPASIVVEEGVRWRRDLFGGRRASKTRKLRAVDRSATMEVMQLPKEGQPASFAGAVGSGFTLQVTADRSVVQVGDPIGLTLTLRSESEAPTAALPQLAESGLSAPLFRVPEGETAGFYEDGAKRFEVSIRVLDARVNEIPPIAYSWFDATSATYRTTHSQPIALSVREAQLVSASDVVRTVDPEAETDSDDGQRQPKPERLQSSNANAERPRFTLTGADLAIEIQPKQLLSGGTPLLATVPMQTILYAAGLMMIIWSWLARRRASVDPAVVKRRNDLKACFAEVEKASSVGTVADALRRMAATATTVPRQELDTLLAECDAQIFGPDGGDSALKPELKAQAAELARTMRGLG